MKLFPSRCYNGGQQHRFEARYSGDSQGRWGADQTNALFWADSDDAKVKLAQALNNKTARQYQGDVCVWCGKVVNQPGVKP